MKLVVTFIEKNPTYSKEYADQYQFGEESVDNPKNIYRKSAELSVDIDDLAFNPQDKFRLLGTLENGKAIDITLEDISTLVCVRHSKIVSKFGISKSILEKTHNLYDKKYNTTRFYFYISPDCDYDFLTNNLCLSNNEIPSEFFS